MPETPDPRLEVARGLGTQLRSPRYDAAVGDPEHLRKQGDCPAQGVTPVRGVRPVPMVG